MVIDLNFGCGAEVVVRDDVLLDSLTAGAILAQRHAHCVYSGNQPATSTILELRTRIMLVDMRNQNVVLGRVFRHMTPDAERDDSVICAGKCRLTARIASLIISIQVH